MLERRVETLAQFLSNVRGSVETTMTGKLLTVRALTALMLAAAARAGPDIAPKAPENLDIAYNLAFWGIPFGETNYAGQFSNGGYVASSHFNTSGIISIFWQATIDANATGRITAHSVSPIEYDSFYRRGSSKKERVKITFNTDTISTSADPPYDTTKYPVSETQKREGVDPMSAITLVLAGVRADRANPCGTVAPVFDGRRRYNIEFTYIKDERVDLGKLFSGTAHRCQVHYRQIAGFKPKILKEGAAFPPIYGDFAEFPAAGAPNGHYVAALKLWARLSWGTVSAELTRLRTPERP
jgi:hypothetical protein